MSEDRNKPQGEQATPEQAQPAPEAAGECDWRPRAEIAHNIAQAKTLREQAATGGLAFEAWLPPQQALWFLGLIEGGRFADPYEALFNLLGEAQDLAPHEDLRKELLKRSLDAALDNPGAPSPIEDCVLDMRGKMKGPQPDPAIWKDWFAPENSATDDSG